MADMKFADRCRTEATRDVIFLLRWRSTKREKWQVDGVWLSREEAEDFRQRHIYRWRHSDVYGVCANGELAEVLKVT